LKKYANKELFINNADAFQAKQEPQEPDSKKAKIEENSSQKSDPPKDCLIASGIFFFFFFSIIISFFSNLIFDVYSSSFPCS